MINLVKLAINSIFAFIKVFDMQLDNVADGIIEHKKARSLLNCVGWFGDVYQIKYRCQYFIHPLDILNFWIEFGVDIQNSGHVVITIALFLEQLVPNKLLVFFLVLPIYQSKFLPSRICQVWQHYVCTWSCKERKLSMCSRCIFLYLLPQKIVALKLLKSRVAFLQDDGVLGKLLLG